MSNGKVHGWIVVAERGCHRAFVTDRGRVDELERDLREDRLAVRVVPAARYDYGGGRFGVEAYDGSEGWMEGIS